LGIFCNFCYGWVFVGRLVAAFANLGWFVAFCGGTVQPLGQFIVKNCAGCLQALWFKWLCRGIANACFGQNTWLIWGTPVNSLSTGSVLGGCFAKRLRVLINGGDSGRANGGLRAANVVKQIHHTRSAFPILSIPPKILTTAFFAQKHA